MARLAKFRRQLTPRPTAEEAEKAFLENTLGVWRATYFSDEPHTIEIEILWDHQVFVKIDGEFAAVGLWMKVPANPKQDHDRIRLTILKPDGVSHIRQLRMFQFTLADAVAPKGELFPDCPDYIAWESIESKGLMEGYDKSILFASAKGIEPKNIPGVWRAMRPFEGAFHESTIDLAADNNAIVTLGKAREGTWSIEGNQIIVIVKGSMKRTMLQANPNVLNLVDVATIGSFDNPRVWFRVK